jgi:hypothetical protein
MTVTVRVTGIPEADRKLAQFELQMRDLRSFWPLVIPLFIGWIGQQFESEGSFFGDPWAQLSEPYASVKAATYGDKPILQREGGLRQSASRPQRRATPTSLELTFDGSGAKHGPIAAYHQEGTTRMPARKLVPESEGELGSVALGELELAAERYVLDVVRRLAL